MADAALLEASDLTRHYQQRGRGRGVVRAVDGVSLGVAAGETLGVVGESGCGKSTLARLLVGIDTPTGGAVRYAGHDVAGLSKAARKQLRRDVQIVMQDPYTSLDPRMTAEQILSEPYEIHAEARRGVDLRSRIPELLEMVGLDPDHRRRYPHEFSGGQRQRIGIARALALRPKVVVCDEPVSALDVSIQAQVINLLADLQRQFGLAYVFIAHDLAVVRQIADRVAVMYLGKVVEEGPSDSVFADPEHPYTRALLSAAPIPDPELRGSPAAGRCCPAIYPAPAIHPAAADSGPAVRWPPTSVPRRSPCCCPWASAMLPPVISPTISRTDVSEPKTTTLPDRQSVREALDYFDRYLGFRQHFQRVPGVQAAVYAFGDVQLSVAHGLADVAASTALTPDHLFRIASHSKTFTSTVVLQLVESGRLRLDEPRRPMGTRPRELPGGRLFRP